MYNKQDGEKRRDFRGVSSIIPGMEAATIH